MLRAHYPDVRNAELTPAFEAFARKLTDSAFPRLCESLSFRLLRSHRRYSAQFPGPEGGLIVIDQGQVTLLSLADLLVGADTAQDKLSLLLLNVPFAEEFRHCRAFDRSLICSSFSVSQHAVLQALLIRLQRNTGHSALGMFLILHEVAHYLIDSNGEFSAPMRASAAAALRAHCDANIAYARAIRAGAPLPPAVTTSVDQEDSAATGLLTRQIDDHVRLVRDNPEVIREAACDTMATAGLINHVTGVDLLADAPAAPKPEQLQTIGEILMLGLRVSRLLMTFECLKQSASQIAYRADPTQLMPPFAEMTARQNITTNLMLEIFSAIVDQAAPPLDGKSRSSGETLRQNLRQSVELLNERSAERLLRHIEDIGKVQRDDDLFVSQRNQMLSALIGQALPTEAELESLSEQWLSRIPF